MTEQESLSSVLPEVGRHLREWTSGVGPPSSVPGRVSSRVRRRTSLTGPPILCQVDEDPMSVVRGVDVPRVS